MYALKSEKWDKRPMQWKIFMGEYSGNKHLYGHSKLLSFWTNDILLKVLQKNKNSDPIFYAVEQWYWLCSVMAIYLNNLNSI